MTCIVALERAGQVYLAGDSFAGGEGEANLTDLPKVQRIGSVAVGFCGSFAAERIAREVLGAYAKRKLSRVQIETVAQQIRDEAKRLDLIRDGEWDAWFLIGCDGEALIVQSDFSVVRSAKGYAAIGSGADYALGALFVSAKEKAPKEILLGALRAAAFHSTTVRGPFHVVAL